MVQDETYFESHDGTKLYIYRWKLPQESLNDVSCDGVRQPKAVLHIVHGMAEHSLRYRPLAEQLTEAGIEVWAADQRGHGKTADLNVNKPGKGGLLGHAADGNSFDCVTKDIHAINKEIRNKFNVPIFLLGHSWGSFIAQNYIEEYSNDNDMVINGCILSGTKGPGELKMKIGYPFLVLFAALRGQRKKSRLVKYMGDGQYNKPLKPNRTSFDWLSRDEEEVDKYAADPLCGKICSCGFYRDLVWGVNKIFKNKEMAKINNNLPVYIFSGSADPVGEMGAGPTALVNVYRELGVSDLEFVLYPGARHEPLNETNREEVIDNLITWINKRCEI